MSRKYKKLTQIAFLVRLYESDTLISNHDAFVLLKQKFR
ncbi:hypothetical protein LCGC14_2309060, partial [marine sediment metagenome]